ncbi:MAG: MBL fold metallo-hydrolase [Candidatus Pacebacteria bacterium]|nr:MBL fold metallo-hydrolase [Candidatus Paceibacterota bacterium]
MVVKRGTIYEMKRSQIGFILGLFCLTLVIWGLVFFFTYERGLTVAFLDIGQGDAIFIETPNKTQVLIDGGPNKSVLRQLGKVMPFYDRSIDMVVATHPDLDHIGGLPSVLDRFVIDSVVWSEASSDSSAYDAFFEKATNEQAKVLYARRGRLVLDVEHGVYLDILFPDRNVEGMEANASSIVTKLVYGDTSFLFMGDAPKSIEKYLVSIDSDELNVDVLKLGHHGSKTSTSEELLAYTTPQYAIISAGKDNRYGHPHEEVLELLGVFEVEYFNIADVGMIVFESDGKELKQK